MSDAQMGAVVKYLRDLVRPPGSAEPADYQLLERFITHREEAAFTALMVRHGPMVHGLCQRLLQHEQDAEDTFQATFLILARKARTIRKHASLASWLYGVAYRLSLKARVSAARRRARERKANVIVNPDHSAEAARREMQSVVDEELNRLPAKWRTPLILCYLEGKTQEEAAEVLGWPVGSMSWRLSRAKARLRDRLTRRGMALAAGTFAVGIAEPVPALAAPLLIRTLKGALLFADGKSAPLALVSAQATALAEMMLRAAANKVKICAVFLGLLIAVGISAGVLARSRLMSQPQSALNADISRVPNHRPQRRAKDTAARTWRQRATFRVSKGSVRALALSPDGKRLASLGMGDAQRNLAQGHIEEELKELCPKIWEATTGKPQRALTDERVVDQISGLAFSPDGKTLATAEAGFALWDAASGNLRATYTEPVSVARVVFSPNSKLLAFARADGPVGICNLATKKTTRLPPVDFPVSDLAVTVDGKTLVVACFNGMVRSWKLPAGELRAKRQLGRSQAERILSRDGRLLAVPVAGLDDPSVQIWDVPRGRLIATLDPEEDQGWISAVAFSGDGKTCATGNSDGILTLWELPGGKSRVRIPALNNRVAALAFSQDGQTLAAGDSEGTVKVWRLEGRSAK
jgi:RNA polymerase sigma factor (sigma-70 family)